MAAGLVGGSRYPDTAVRDVLMGTGIQARRHQCQGFDEFPGGRRVHPFRQRDVQVPAAAGGDIRDVAQTARVQQPAQTLRILIHHTLQRLGGIQVQAQGRHGPVDPVDEHGRRPGRQRPGDPGRVLGPRVLEAAADPPARPVHRRARDQRGKNPRLPGGDPGSDTRGCVC